MERATENKIVVVKRKTRLDELIIRFNTVLQAKFYIESLGADFNDYLNEHNLYNDVINSAVNILSGIGRVQVIDRFYLPNFIFGDNDIVIAIGQDGLVANTFKYLNNQPLIGVNPDPARFDGVLLPFGPDDLSAIATEVITGKRAIKEISIAEARLNDGQCLYAVNDFFIGRKTHVSARYELKYGALSEFQISSGIIVSTGLGSSGWLKSILAGTSGVMTALYRKDFPVGFTKKMEWDADYLIFSVREPFPSKTSGTKLAFGAINNAWPFTVKSTMPEGGVIFSDGIENDFLSFNSGVSAEIKISGKKGRLVV